MLFRSVTGCHDRQGLAQTVDNGDGTYTLSLNTVGMQGAFKGCCGARAFGFRCWLSNESGTVGEGDLNVTWSPVVVTPGGEAVTMRGEDGPSVEIRIEDGVMQWAVEGSGAWHDLVAMEDLKGARGADGVAREVELAVADGWVVWRRTGESQYMQLVPLSALTGARGADGASVSMSVHNAAVWWRRDGDAAWSLLYNLSAVTGPQGPDGRKVIINVVDGWIVWRHDGVDEPWQNIVRLVDLMGPAGATGPQGPAGKDGQDGQDGVDGRDGVDGKDGKDADPVKTLFNPDGSESYTIDDGVVRKVVRRSGWLLELTDYGAEFLIPPGIGYPNLNPPPWDFSIPAGSKLMGVAEGTINGYAAGVWVEVRVVSGNPVMEVSVVSDAFNATSGQNYLLLPGLIIKMPTSATVFEGDGFRLSWEEESERTTDYTLQTQAEIDAMKAATAAAQTAANNAQGTANGAKTAAQSALDGLSAKQAKLDPAPAGYYVVPLVDSEGFILYQLVPKSTNLATTEDVTSQVSVVAQATAAAQQTADEALEKAERLLPMVSLGGAPIFGTGNFTGAILSVINNLCSGFSAGLIKSPAKSAEYSKTIFWSVRGDVTKLTTRRMVNRANEADGTTAVYRFVTATTGAPEWHAAKIVDLLPAFTTATTISASMVKSRGVPVTVAVSGEVTDTVSGATLTPSVREFALNVSGVPADFMSDPAGWVLVLMRDDADTLNRAITANFMMTMAE